MFKKSVFISLILVVMLPFLVFGQEKKKAVYFYNTSCSHCFQVDQYFQKNGIYDKYEIKKIETSDKENLAYLNRFFDAFGVEAQKRGWPVIFFGNKMLIGDKPIIDNFASDIENTEAGSFPTPESIRESTRKDSGEQKAEEAKGDSSISLPILIGAALVDAINPCAFAVLILLIATVLAAKGKNQALFSGLFFSLSVFVSYFLMGLGLYKAISAVWVTEAISIVVGGIAILIGLANLKDYFWYGKFFVMEVPFSWRPKMQEILKHVTSPFGAVTAGFLVSLFLLPCTSGPYIVILGLLAQKESLTRTIPLLFLYNFIFILPMIVITVGMYFGVRMKKLEEWRQSNLRLLHAVAGVAMLFIGGYLVYQWI